MSLLAVSLGAAGCTKDEGSVEGFCRALRVAPPLASVVSGFTESDQATLERRVDDAASAYDRLADEAPGAIRGDVEQVVALVDAVLDAVRANGGDAEATATDIRAAVKAHPRAEASSAAVAAYARERCDVDLNPTVPPDRSSTTRAPSSTTDAGGRTTGGT